MGKFPGLSIVVNEKLNYIQKLYPSRAKYKVFWRGSPLCDNLFDNSDRAKTFMRKIIDKYILQYGSMFQGVTTEDVLQEILDSGDLRIVQVKQNIVAVEG